MTFCPRRIVSTISSMNSGFYSRLNISTLDYVHKRLSPFDIMSTWHFVHLGGCLLQIGLSWESGHMIICPCRIVSNIDSFNYGFCPRVVMSTWESVYMGGCLLWICQLGSLATWHSSHAGLFPLLILSTLDCAHFWLCLLGSQSTWVVVYLESVHLEIWPHDILPL